MKQYNLLELLDYINPSKLSYQEWTNVGMALKHEGYEASDWDSWSAQDSERYKRGECFTKWNSFNEEAGAIVTGGTIFEYAKKGGWHPPVKEKYKDGAIDWDDEIGSIIDTDSVDSIELQEPSDDDWHPSNELIRYLSTLFETDDYVGFVMQSMENGKGKYIPGNRGIYKMTAGELIEKLHKCNDDIGEVLGDYNQEAGAWIRFNPLNGEGVRNTDIASFKYALVESDSLDIGKQLSIIHQLELPVAAVVYSGAKSIHAIVKVDASDNKEYRERVSYLYKICDKNGLEVDSQNKNPSRLSRMPGVIRGEHKQFIIETNTGKETWSDWVEWVESMNDDLPDEENLADVLFNLPDYAEELIEGILRQGHKMLLVGPSKSGKSFSLIELCIAIAEGTKWMGRQCKQGDVLYVNFELDRASCLHRFKDAITDQYCYRATVVTKNYRYTMIIDCSTHKHRMIEEMVPHYFGDVPIIEYRNNKLCIGDFEQQISLIDAYNKLMSDRVNDKEQFVEALLVVYGSLMGDDNEEVSETMKILKENGLLELPSEARAEYISRTFDESGMEVLRKAIKEDIYTFSHVPNLTDENFVGNSSGVAMEYKLLGLQMITGEKEKYYKKGLRRRIDLFCNYLGLKAININKNNIKITFTRKLPKNLNELAQMIANLSGKVSNETLIEQLPFVEDASNEAEKVKKENEENIKTQQALFKSQNEVPFYDEKDAPSDSEDDESDSIGINKAS